MLKIKLYLIAAIGSIAALFAIFMRGKQVGKSELEAKQNANNLQKVQAQQNVRNHINAASVGERKRLRQKWTRK
jgi:ABC-type protease/lipase transport system fused ATPase/permease subunit